jgi:hypothetical protein
MKTGEIIHEKLNSGINPEVEATIGYFENELGVSLRNHSVFGKVTEIDKNSGYCKVKINNYGEMIIHLDSIKLI